MDRKRLIGAGLCGLLFLGLGGCDSRQAETSVMKVDLETEDAGGQAVAEDVFRIERIANHRTINSKQFLIANPNRQ